MKNAHLLSIRNLRDAEIRLRWRLWSYWTFTADGSKTTALSTTSESLSLSKIVEKECGDSMSLNKSDSTLKDGDRRGDSTGVEDGGIEVTIFWSALTMLGWMLELSINLNIRDGNLQYSECQDSPLTDSPDVGMSGIKICGKISLAQFEEGDEYHGDSYSGFQNE